MNSPGACRENPSARRCYPTELSFVAHVSCCWRRPDKNKVRSRLRGCTASCNSLIAPGKKIRRILRRRILVKECRQVVVLTWRSCFKNTPPPTNDMINRNADGAFGFAWHLKLNNQDKKPNKTFREVKFRGTTTGCSRRLFWASQFKRAWGSNV